MLSLSSGQVLLDLQIKTEDDPGLWGVTGTEAAVGHPLVPVPTVETKKPDLRWLCHAHQKALADPWAGGRVMVMGLFLPIRKALKPEIQAQGCRSFSATLQDQG